MVGNTPAVAPQNIWNRKTFSELFTGTAQQEPAAPSVKPAALFLGEPAVFFEKQDITELVVPFRLCLIGKFSYGKPTMENLRKEFHTVGFKGSFSIGWLDPRHVLIRFDLEEHYMRLWLKRKLEVAGISHKSF